VSTARVGWNRNIPDTNDATFSKSLPLRLAFFENSFSSAIPSLYLATLFPVSRVLPVFFNTCAA
jgi:hypothetical protein